MNGTQRPLEAAHETRLSGAFGVGALFGRREEVSHAVAATVFVERDAGLDEAFASVHRAVVDAVTAGRAVLPVKEDRSRMVKEEEPAAVVGTDADAIGTLPPSGRSGMKRLFFKQDFGTTGGTYGNGMERDGKPYRKRRVDDGGALLDIASDNDWQLDRRGHEPAETKDKQGSQMRVLQRGDVQAPSRKKETDSVYARGNNTNSGAEARRRLRWDTVASGAATLHSGGGGGCGGDTVELRMAADSRVGPLGEPSAFALDM